MKQAGKIKRLKSILRGYGSCLVAYSGGVDSAFLAYIASRCLDSDKLFAVTAISPTYPRQELAAAKRWAARWGIAHEVIRTDEFKDRLFVRNTSNRCFYCKRTLFSRLRRIASRKGLAAVLEASTLSDLKDYRPGSRAKKIFQVRSPLIDAGFTKSDVRRLSRQLKLPTWDKPSCACLASRVPYGVALSAGILRKIARAEETLQTFGFEVARARHYGSLCRIEIPPGDFGRFLRVRRKVADELKKIGYSYVTLDVEGFRSGSMNEVIRKLRR